MLKKTHLWSSGNRKWRIISKTDPSPPKRIHNLPVRHRTTHFLEKRVAFWAIKMTASIAFCCTCILTIQLETWDISKTNDFEYQHKARSISIWQLVCIKQIILETKYKVYQEKHASTANILCRRPTSIPEYFSRSSQVKCTRGEWAAQRTDQASSILRRYPSERK